MPAIRPPPVRRRRAPPATRAAAAASEPTIDLVPRAPDDGDSALQQELLALFDKQSASLLALSSDRSASGAARRRRPSAQGLALALGPAVARAAAVERRWLGRGRPRRSNARSLRWRRVAAARIAVAELRG